MPDYLITWIHLAAAIILIGGLMFSQFVLTPVARKTPSDSKAREVVRLSGRRFRTIAWVSLILLILTGAYQMLNESGSARIETMWGVVLMLKLFLFIIAFGLLLIHDFIIDPYAPSSQDTLAVGLFTNHPCPRRYPAKSRHRDDPGRPARGFVSVGAVELRFTFPDRHSRQNPRRAGVRRS